MAAIFLSHSSKDNDNAIEIKAWLESQGHSVFLDFDPEAGIKGGTDWEQTLYDRLRICRVVLPLLSRNWLSSKWCFAEVVHARYSGKLIVPMKIGDCDATEVFPAIQQIDLTVDPAEGFRRLELALQEVFPWDAKRPPFPGLLTFQKDDAAIFFGRSPEISNSIETLESLRRRGAAAAHFVLLLGASGSGKSSLVRAGLLPRLSARDGWLIVPPFRPREQPLSELATSLAQAYEQAKCPLAYTEINKQLNQAIDSNAADGNALLDILRDLAIKAQCGEATVLLVMDQAEELFGAGGSPRTDDFLSLLRSVLEQAHDRVMVLATMRSEFLGIFQTHSFLLDPTYSEPFAYEQISVDPLPIDRFSEIIRGPTDLAGLIVDDELVDRMVKDTATRDALPLLAYTLRRLWDNDDYREDNRFELSEYQALGGLEGSIRKAADEALGRRDLTDKQMQALRAAFVPTMIQVTTDNTRVRRQAYRDQLPQEAETTIQRFIDARLLITDRDRQGRETIEVAHEALLRVWPQLDIWLEQDQDKLRLYESINSAAQEWQAGNRAADLIVHRGDRLDEAHMLVREPRFAWRPDSVESDYIAACQAAQTELREKERQQQERRIRDAERIAEAQKITVRRTRIGLFAALSLAMVASVIGFFAWNWANEADRQQQFAQMRLTENYWQDALKARKEGERIKALHLLARTAANSVNEEKEKLALLGIHDYIRSTYLETMTEGFVDAELPEGVSLPIPPKAILSNDEQRILTWLPGDSSMIGNGIARLWPVYGKTPISKPLKHDYWIHGARFLASDSKILTWGGGYKKDQKTSDQGEIFQVGEALVWNAESGAIVGSVMKHNAPIIGATLNKDESKLLTWGEDRVINLWNTKDGMPLRSPIFHMYGVAYAGFSDNEEMIFTVDRLAKCYQWLYPSLKQKSLTDSLDETDLAEPQLSECNRFMEPDHWLDGRDLFFRMKSATRDSRLLIETHVRTAEIREIVKIDVDPEGVINDKRKQLLTWGATEGRIRLLDAASGEQIFEMSHKDPIHRAAFNHDGSRFFTQSIAPGRVRLWNTINGKEIGYPKNGIQYEGAIFSPNGQYFVTIGQDKSVSLWDSDDGEVITQLQHNRKVEGVAFSKDEYLLLSWDDKGMVIVSPVNKSGARSRIMQHEGPVFEAAFNQDETKVLTISGNGIAKLWNLGDLSDTENVMVEPEKDSPVTQALTLYRNCNADKSKCLKIDEKTVQVFKQIDKSPATPLMMHDEPVEGAVFNEENNKILTWTSFFSPWGRTAGAVQVWNAHEGTPLTDPMLHKEQVNGAFFFADDTRVFSWSEDATARIWNASTGETVTILKHRKAIKGAQLSDDGQKIITWGEDKTAKLWSAIDGKPISLPMVHDSEVIDAAFGKDQRWIFTKSSDGNVRLWSSEDGSPLIQAVNCTKKANIPGYSRDEARTARQCYQAMMDEVMNIDFDFPSEHLTLLVETSTGTELDQYGNVRFLSRDEWFNRKAEYKLIAEQHLKVCAFKQSNIYSRQVTAGKIERL